MVFSRQIQPNWRYIETDLNFGIPVVLFVSARPSRNDHQSREDDRDKSGGSSRCPDEVIWHLFFSLVSEMGRSGFPTGGFWSS
jgi:hypothetical protein